MPISDRRLEEAARVITGAGPTAVNLSGACAGPWRRPRRSQRPARRAAEAAEAFHGSQGPSLPRTRR